MFDQLDTFRMARALTGHATARQAIMARNVANADTPGYRAGDLRDFTESYARAGNVTLRRTDPRHLAGAGPDLTDRIIDAGGEPSPNGNTVSLEGEMLRQAQIRKQHDLAVTVYKSSLTLLRTSLGRRG